MALRTSGLSLARDCPLVRRSTCPKHHFYQPCLKQDNFRLCTLLILVCPQERTLLTTIKRKKLARVGHISRLDSLSKTILQDTVEGTRRRWRPKENWCKFPCNSMFSRVGGSDIDFCCMHMQVISLGWLLLVILVHVLNVLVCYIIIEVTLTHTIQYTADL